MQALQLDPKLVSAFELFGTKWTYLIIYILSIDAKRFKKISSVIPNISERVLSDRLNKLIAAGIITKRVYSEEPMCMKYELTEKGKNLKPVVNAIQNWVEKF
ncbi:helix-turn-helix transcriptional regulator [Bacillus paramycoides]|uniref:winged helix-turn-helix transcriptional regulator n=1 Tax=Bacillus paramycoides TaxID=2026194 RepID=UPI002244D7F4|nr:helix-turn-helix domain-containing protein [Bacillus paramycoides]MCW9134410.1 helix-turn-helix transcriptional regulator [Bacillus paramycoides]